MAISRRLFTLCLTIAACAACGDDGDADGDGDGGGDGGGDAVNFAGTWTGAATEDKGGGPYAPTFTFVLSQSGAAITGTFVDSITPTYADSGTVAGSVNGDSAVVTITLADPPPITRCAGSLTGTVRIVGGELVGGYAGRDCDFLAGGPDPNRTATFALPRR